jgi:predicted nucleic acid-binding protein
VAIVYFDASALVKLIVDESGSDLAAQLWDDCDASVASRLAYPEVRAALAAAGRNHDLDPSGLAQAQQAWEQFWPAVRPVELTRPVERHAGELAARHSLRGADAVHLASVLAVDNDHLILAAWDRRLRSGASAAGLAIAPAALDS